MQVDSPFLLSPRGPCSSAEPIPHVPHHLPPSDTDTHFTPPRRRPRTTPANAYSFARTREVGDSRPIHPRLVSNMERDTLRRLDTGRYVALDRPAPLVRSTISIAFSHDGRYFASTHGDHSVKVFDYPSGKQIACLDGHPRTPWIVRFHPTNSSIIASGCLGNDCRVWDLTKNECIRKHKFGSSISCVSFSPDGSLLAVTSGCFLLLWDYMQPTRDGSRHTSSEFDDEPGPGLPVKQLEGTNPFHMVDFHPSGTMIMTGEKNNTPTTSPDNPTSQDKQFTLRLRIHRFDRHFVRQQDQPVLVVPRAVAYNDAGTHFSPCGTMLAACIPDPSNDSFSFHIAVMSLVARASVKIGTVLYQAPLDSGHVSALTNLKFSSTSRHLLAGFSFRPLNPVLLNPVLRGHAENYDATANGRGLNSGRPPQVRVVNIYEVDAEFKQIRSLCADMDVSEGHGGAEDEINVAVFAPVRGVADGVVYGTQKGRIRMFQPVIGTGNKHPSLSDKTMSHASEEWSTRMPDMHDGFPVPIPEGWQDVLLTAQRLRAASTRTSSAVTPSRDVPARHNSV